MAFVIGIFAQDAQPKPGAAPFLNLRDSTLAYNGPETTLTNITEFRIGWFGPTNGSSDGGAWWAANRAVDEANAQGSNLPFRLLPWWTADPWRSGVSLLARNVYDEQPLALVCPVDSASTHLAEQVTAKAGLVLVSPASTDKSATLAGVSWMFSCAPSDNVIARSLVSAVLDSLKPGDKLVLLSGTDHPSRMRTREIIREFKRRQRLPDFQYEFSDNETDYSGQIAALHALQPHVIVSTVEVISRLLPVLNEVAPGSVIFGSPALGSTQVRELAKKKGIDIRVPELCRMTFTDPIGMRFSQTYIREFGHPPGHEAVLTYDAMRLLIEAIRKAGPTRSGVRDAMSQITPWTGIGGTIQFDGTGQNVRTNVSIVSLIQQ